jgi:hypothetical protein
LSVRELSVLRRWIGEKREAARSLRIAAACVDRDADGLEAELAYRAAVIEAEADERPMPPMSVELH